MQTQANTLFRLLTLTTIFMTQRWEAEDKEWSGEMDGGNELQRVGGVKCRSQRKKLWKHNQKSERRAEKWENMNFGQKFTYSFPVTLLCNTFY